jgi:ABC-2 type transport system permease protein
MTAMTTSSTVTAPALPAHRRPLARLVRTEFKLFVRERIGPIWGVGFPIGLLIIFGFIPAFQKHQAVYGGQTTLDVYVPILIAFTTAIMSLSALPTVLGTYREQGVLRRLQTTPMGPVRVLAAQLAVQFATLVAVSAAILIIARFGFSVPLPRELGAFVIAALLAMLALLSIGLFVAAVAPTAKVAQAVGTIVFFPMMFFAGLWLPIASMPKVLQHISHATPLGAAVQALNDSAQGHWPTALALGTLAAWAVVFAALAVRTFRWE